MTAALPAHVHPRSPWPPALASFALLVAVVGWFYRDTAVAMAGIWWRSDTFAHCMLVPPITLWLVWRQRAELAALAPRPQPWLLLPMLGVAAVWLLAELVTVNAASQFAFTATLVLAVPAVFGLAVARTILFPLLFLFLAVPFGDFALPTMMDWTATFVVGALQMSGIPVYREGQNFVIPSGNWSVIDECSGIRYLMASFMAGSLFAYLSYRSWRRRAAFMALAIVVPIVANWLRAYVIVMLGHFSGNKLAVGADHLVYGWVFFGLIIVAMFFIGARWSEAPAPPRVPVRRDTTAASSRNVAAAALAVAAVALLPHGLLAALRQAEGAAAAPRLELPTAFGDWAATTEPIADWKPDYDDATVRAQRHYAAPAGRVGVVVDYYRGQTESSKLVSSQHPLVGRYDNRWSLPSEDAREVELDGRRVAVRRSQILGRVSIGGPQPRLVVWRLYWIDGRFVGGDVPAKLAGAMARLAGRGDDGASILVWAAGPADASGEDPADAAIAAFLNDNDAALGALLQRVRDSR